jgi:hypothetical protein
MHRVQSLAHFILVCCSCQNSSTFPVICILNLCRLDNVHCRSEQNVHWIASSPLTEMRIAGHVCVLVQGVSCSSSKPSHSVAATTTPLLLAIFLVTHIPKARSE